MRKILGFVVGGLSALFLFFAYQNLAGAGDDKALGGGKKKDPCNDFVSKAKGLKNPDFRGGKVLECSVKTNVHGLSEDDCTKSKMKDRGEAFCEKQVQSSDYEVSSWSVRWEEKADECRITCDIKKKTGGTATASPVASPVSSASPIASADPIATASPVASPTIEVVVSTASPSASPVSSASPVASADPIGTASPVASPIASASPVASADPVPEKTCSEDQIVAQLKKIISEDKTGILDKQFEVTYMKVAYRALKQDTGKTYKSVEKVIADQTKKLNALNAADGNKISDQIIALYAKMGQPMDAAAVRDLIEKLKTKTNYEMKVKRADNLDVSTYVLASRALETQPSGNLEYKDIDSAILWYQDVLAKTLEDGIRDGKRGAASSNLQYASVRLAHYLGYVTKAPRKESDLLAKLDKDSAELKSLMDQAEDKLIAWYRENCQKVDCPNCAVDKIHDTEQNNRWLKAIKGVIDEMSKDPTVRQSKATEGNKIIRPDKWKDKVTLTVIDPSPISNKVNVKPMTQSNKGIQVVSQVNLNPSTPAPATPLPATAVPATAVPATAVPATAVPATALPQSTAVPATVIPAVINNRSTDPNAIVGASVLSLKSYGDCDTVITVDKMAADKTIKVTVSLVTDAGSQGNPVTVILAEADYKDEATAKSKIDTQAAAEAYRVSHLRGGVGHGCGL